MTKEKGFWWMVKMTAVLLVILNTISYAYGSGVWKESYSNGTSSHLSLLAEKKPCKGDHTSRFHLGEGMEWIEYVKCTEKCSCGKDHKCVDINDFTLNSHLCARECNGHNDCEYPQKCLMKEKYCYWEKCRSNADCENPLICNTAGILIEKRCGRRSCDDHAECKDNQVCDYEPKTCVCAKGLSGKKCEVVDWCKEDGKFKDCKNENGTCKYIKERRTVDCICDNGRKLHFGQMRCVETCSKDEDCKNGGTCKYKNGLELCSCKLGLFGEKCEIVFDCTPNGKYKYCESSGGKCYHDGNKAICECSGNKRLNDKNFKCEDCICRGGECSIQDGKRVCKCPPGYGNFTDSICKACDCGPDTDCIWEARFGGRKLCLCKPGYSTKKGKCVACKCGPDSNCEWISERWLEPEKKVCHCKSGYHEENGKCVVMGTTSLEDTSVVATTVLPTTKKDCHCGSFSYSCSLDSTGNKVCNCFMGYSQLGGSCAECNCGPYGRCNFEQGRKKCLCSSFATEINGVCVDKQDFKSFCKNP